MTRSRMLQDADGREIEIVDVEAEACSPAQLHAALRTLTRLLVRQYRGTGDPVANPGDSKSPSALTSSPLPRTHPGDEAA